MSMFVDYSRKQPATKLSQCSNLELLVNTSETMVQLFNLLNQMAFLSYSVSYIQLLFLNQCQNVTSITQKHHFNFPFILSLPIRPPSSEQTPNQPQYQSEISPRNTKFLQHNKFEISLKSYRQKALVGQQKPSHLTCKIIINYIEMFRGNSLAMYVNKSSSKAKDHSGSSLKCDQQQNPELPNLRCSKPTRPSSVWRVKLDRYTRKIPEIKSNRANVANSVVQVVTAESKDPQNLIKPRERVRVSPRFKRMNYSKVCKSELAGSASGSNCTDIAEPLTSYFKGSQGQGVMSASCDSPIDIYHDYHNDMKHACLMAKQIKVELMKPINLKKLVKQTKTVVLDLDETLIHCVFSSPEAEVTVGVTVQGQTIETGLNIRPQCRWFLEELSNIAEVVVWTASQSNYADAVLKYIDPDSQFISHRLYRDHCTFSYGVYLKDLRRINRPLDSMVIVDNSVFCFMLQMDNGIPVHPYFQGSDDQELPKLLDYLKLLLKQPDVRVMNRDHLALQRFRTNQPTSKSRQLR